jgi:molecular chaperone DnaK
VEGPSDKRGGERQPVPLLVRLPYGSVDEFVERFAINMSRGGIFLRARDPRDLRPVGTILSLEIRIQPGETVLRAVGVVRWIQSPEPAASGKPPLAPGMGIQFTKLDEASRAVVDRMVALREKRGAPGAAAPAPSPSPAKVGPAPAATPVPARAPAGVPPAARGASAPTPVPAPGPTPPRTAPPRTAATPAPVSPTSSPRAPRAAPGSPVQADLSLPHKVEQLSAGPARVAIGIPDVPVPIKKPSKTIIGIDLGTTNSCAAVVKDGKPFVIPSREGYNTVPSIVALNARNRIVVGHLARAQLLTNPRQTVWGAKRLVGRAYESQVVQDIKSKFAYEIVAGPEGLAAVKLGSEVLRLEQVSALVLAEVKEVAQNHLAEEVNRAVITVPAYYNERQRAAVREAGALAGLQVERILNEPTAAALAYAYGRRVNQRVLVYDLGGGTFDASVLELNENVFEVISTGGNTFLGGVDFDARIVERLLEVWKEQTGDAFAGDRVALSRLVDAAERAKCALSERTEFAVQLPFLAMKEGRPLSLETSLSRQQIVELVAPLVDQTIEVCREVLAAKNLTPADIDEVLLVGGQSRMPLVHEQVAAFFGKQPSRAVHPDEAVAVGAALLADSLGSAEGVVLIDVLPMSIGIGLPGDRVKTIIERNTPLPVRKQYGLTTTRDGQTDFELVVLQGESPRASQCEYLGTVRLEGLPAGPRGMVKIAVSFELGAECLLTVTARELNSGRQVQAPFSAKGGPNAARQKLDEGLAKGATGSFPVAGTPPNGVPLRKRTAPGPLRRFFNKLLGRAEAR